MEIKKGPLFYIFRHCATFSERKNFFQKFQVFFQKNVLRFLSLRYSADFRRSRLVFLSGMTKNYHTLGLGGGGWGPG